MSNGARHGLGVLVGLIVAPAVAACLMYGANKLRLVLTFGFARFQSYHGKEMWIGAGLVLLVGIMLGLVTGSRLSPLASLIPGAVFTAIGLVWFASPRWAVDHPGRDVLPRDMDLGYTTLGSLGIFFLLGVMLLVASLAPSRWKARTPAGAAPRFAGPPPAPMGPPPMPGAAHPMPGAPAPLGAPAPMGAPAQSPSWQGTPQPQYGQPPAQPASSGPPPLPPSSPTPPAQEKKAEPSADDEDDGPGEWTRMYGGNRPK
ncbi:hypothetical protein HUT06_37725 [Actinomadura sp. NAK00032]|uniref:hypothetical protein n=1 Tax=Actinomadura sp. NAK00032 TaxID=2742128 RepID=UPI0015920C29|nr:hypothetical protein [Actinomadura sp. NAK00032]QKW39058.1 hypothetical protein HUT06_37725 [Actinomadura sp. NAK00032]